MVKHIQKKKEIMDMVPEGGDWRVQKKFSEYLKGSFFRWWQNRMAEGYRLICYP